MDFYKRLDKKYHHTDPVEHILGTTFRPVAEYDDLYENQTRFDGVVWTKFKETYNLNCQFHNDLQDVDFSKDITCLWFFRERSDRDAGNDIKLADKVITFHANALFITPSKEIKIQKRKVYFPRRPCVQIDINNEVYVNIKKGLGINE
jgi:hypothetical protein